MYRRAHRNAFTIIELLVSIAIIGVLAALILPAVQAAREAARSTTCLNNMRQIGIALHNYHEAHSVLPPFVVWGGPPGEQLGMGILPVGVKDRVALGEAPTNEPDRTYANWLILILPFLDQEPLQASYDMNLPVGDVANAGVRMTDLPILKCPTDPFSRSNNRYERARLAGGTGNDYARGNYAMNLGTNSGCFHFPDGSALPPTCVEGFHVNGTDLLVDNTQMWGNGVGGINTSFRFRDMTAGLSKVVAVEEIRAGVHPLDSRGVWALGFAGASGTARHGLNNGADDDNGPNNSHPSSDDIVGCSELKAAVAPGFLDKNNMPCFSGDPFFQINAQATARSLHPGGVHVMVLDGSAHFVSENINAEIWHFMHRRENDVAFEMPF